MRDLKQIDFYFSNVTKENIYMLSPISGLSTVIVRFGVCRVDDCTDAVSLVSCWTVVIVRFNKAGVRGVEPSIKKKER